MGLVQWKSLIAMGASLLLSGIAWSQTESLAPQFVQIESTNTTAVSFSVLNVAKDLIEKAQTRYYSLLSWKLHQRTTDLQIDNYDRKAQFGRWVNDPNDDVCYNTRAKVLTRDSKGPIVYKEANHCVVDQGTWNDPYTGTTMTTASDIQIDHLVPLKNAYVSGAFAWAFRVRCLYANYLGYDFHLLSVSGHENMKKSDKGPDQYMPPNPSYACTYVRNWLTVKLLWGLTMTVEEANGIRQIISDNGCSVAQMRLSETEVLRQAKFAQENQDLCEKIDHP
jgi:hypothetical protein